MDTELARLVFNQTVDKYHCALDEVNKGSIQPFLDLFSKEDDISLANPNGVVIQGYKQVMEIAQNTFPKLAQAESASFKNLVTFVNCDFAYLVENEQYNSKAGSHQDPDQITLRATTIFRLESGGWKVVHRHADPIDSKMLVETML